jgi:hypothetical protein
MKEIEITILCVLDEASPNMVREKRLLADVNVESDNVVTKADFDRALRDLQTKEGGAQIVGIGGEDGSKWKITPEGKARLATL